MAILLICLALFPLTASANFQDWLIQSHSYRRSDKNVQWTLSDWLSQKWQVKLEDEWLAMHKSRHIAELALGGAYEKYAFKTDNGTSTTNTPLSAQLFNADFYLTLFNVYGEYQKTDDGIESFAWAGGLRILGSSVQTTALVARYGIRHLDNLQTQEIWQNPFAEGVFQLYICSAFGLSAAYRYYFSAKSNQGDSMSGHKVSAGAFIESGFIRLYGEYYQEPFQITSSTGAPSTQESDGIQAGAKFMF